MEEKVEKKNCEEDNIIRKLGNKAGSRLSITIMAI